MHELATLTDRAGDQMTITGLALETIANLLGADGCEHHLDPREVAGLRHAVLALAAHVKETGYDLCDAAESAQAGGKQ